MKNKYSWSLVLLLIGGITGNVFRFVEPLPQHAADFSSIPLVLDGYVGVERSMDQATSDVLRATNTSMRNYRGPDGSEIDLFIGYFRSQKFGSSIHSPKHCLPGGGWQIRSNRPHLLELDPYLTTQVNNLIIEFGGRQMVMFYWFETRSGATRNEYGLKFDLFTNALMMRPTDAAFVRVTVTAGDGDPALATAQAEAFLATFCPYIKQALPF